MPRDFWNPKDAAIGMRKDRKAAAKSISRRKKTKTAKLTASHPVEPNFYKSLSWRQIRYLALKNSVGCNCCGARAKDGVQLHVDHIKPISRYPELKLSLDNLQVLCDDCNIGKGSWDETDWR